MARTTPASTQSGLAMVLEPRSIALIGASERSGSVGAAIMRNLMSAGFSGRIFPINPRRSSILGLRSWNHVTDVLEPIDLAIICTPASTVPDLARECGAAGVGGLLIITAGFREAGPEGSHLESALKTELARFPAMRTLGPNCVGLMVPRLNLNATFAQISASKGNIALLSQSGALCTAMLGWAQDEGIGFSHFISMGNMLDVGFDDLLDYVADRPETDAIVMYMESITHPHRFISAAKRCTKPIIVYKAGRMAAGAKAATSHTGAMAGEDAVYQAAFDEAGIIRVNRFDDLFATAELLARGCRPRGKRLAIVTNAGGPGVIATDILISKGGELASLSPATLQSLHKVLPACWSHGNPVDVIGDADAERLASATDCVIHDSETDGVLVIITPQAMIDSALAAKKIAALAKHTRMPVLASWMGGSMMRDAINILQSSSVSTFPDPEQAIVAFMHLAEHSCRQDALASAETGISHIDQLSAEAPLAAQRILRNRTGCLGEIDSKALLSLYGIPVLKTIAATSVMEALEASRSLGYPVAMKILSPQISHKSDVGGVRLDLRSPEEVTRTFMHIRESLAVKRPDATFAGVTIQTMVDTLRGIELIVGARRDATFGPIVLIGAGGVAAEIHADRAIAMAPTSPDRVLQLIQSLRIAPLLSEFRGRPALDVSALVGIVVRLSRLIAELPQVSEVEANPLLVEPSGAIALDARVILHDVDMKAGV